MCSKTRVILYSSGLDSFCGFHLLERQAPPGEHWKRVYFDLGTKYADRELKSLALGDMSNMDGGDILLLGDYEQEDGFVPQRNALLVTLAQAVYGADEIALCGVRGEFSRDKHPQFYRQMSKLLSYTAGKPVKVFSPFEKLTKSQALRAYLRVFGTGEDKSVVPEVISHTVSCYSGEDKPCGQCASCFRRWVALENNGLAGYEELLWKEPPWIAYKKKPVGTLRSLPKSQWLDFAAAQRDVITAYARLIRREPSAAKSILH